MSGVLEGCTSSWAALRFFRTPLLAFSPSRAPINPSRLRKIYLDQVVYPPSALRATGDTGKKSYWRPLSRQEEDAILLRRKRNIDYERNAIRGSCGQEQKEYKHLTLPSIGSGLLLCPLPLVESLRASAPLFPYSHLFLLKALISPKAQPTEAPPEPEKLTPEEPFREISHRTVDPSFQASKRSTSLQSLASGNPR
jgi:hypothetical protein